jgi:hypothetical protein
MVQVASQPVGSDLDKGCVGKLPGAGDEGAYLAAARGQLHE